MNEHERAAARHAHHDMSAIGQEGRITHKATFMDRVRANHAQMPSLRGQLAAMFREALKDIRGTINQVFFGQSEHPAEPGTPLNPTPQVVTMEQGYDFRAPETYAKAKQPRSKGMEL